MAFIQVTKRIGSVKTMVNFDHVLYFEDNFRDGKGSILWFEAFHMEVTETYSEIIEVIFQTIIKLEQDQKE